MRIPLFIALFLLLIFYLGRLLINIPQAAQRWEAGIGAVIFTLYLVYDFNRLEKISAAGRNDWPTAANIAIDLYLDIINLFTQLLEAMGG